MNNKTHEIEKTLAVVAEVEASFKFITEGLKSLKVQKSIIQNNHVPLQLLASGIERIIKILLLLKDKHLEGNFPKLQKTRERFRHYDNGHGIEKMLDELIEYSNSVDLMKRIPMVVEDMEYLEIDPNFRTFIKIITNFSIQQRYYYIDTIVSESTDESLNAFQAFRKFIYSFKENVDTNQMTYEQEEEFGIKSTIICIEKGVRAISRFFTHGLGDLGRMYYDNFSNFILLRDEKLGLLEYSEKQRLPSDSYKPMKQFSFRFIKLLLFSKSKKLLAKNHLNWAFNVRSVEVYSNKLRLGYFYFAKINNKIYALTTSTSHKYQIPNYVACDKLKPKQVALYLLEEAKTL